MAKKQNKKPVEQAPMEEVELAMEEERYELLRTPQSNGLASDSANETVVSTFKKSKKKKKKKKKDRSEKKEDTKLSPASEKKEVAESSVDSATTKTKKRPLEESSSEVKEKRVKTEEKKRFERIWLEADEEALLDAVITFGRNPLKEKTEFHDLVRPLIQIEVTLSQLESKSQAILGPNGILAVKREVKDKDKKPVVWVTGEDAWFVGSYLLGSVVIDGLSEETVKHAWNSFSKERKQKMEEKFRVSEMKAIKSAILKKDLILEFTSSVMTRAWIVDGPWIASNIKNASVSSALQIKDCGASINCPNCSYCIDNSNVLTPTWPGLPKGVKFDPTDEEVIEHLEAKCGIDGLKPHFLIQDFIFSVADINYTHPQNLPGANKDGTSVFFFNKTEKAYTKGERKRRKITPSCLKGVSVRWHKTGKTKPVLLNGIQRGLKKVMVLYKSARKGSKPEKLNWVLHQYHLGTEEEEIGTFVVSKITYQQQKQCEKTRDESESFGVSIPEDEIAYEDTNIVLDSFVQGLDNIPEASSGLTSDATAHVARDMNVTEDNLVCKNVEASSSFVEKNLNHGNLDIASEKKLVSDLDNADLGTLTDFLSFASEESLFNCLGWT
ncbi:hypothetical protein AALP_AA8G146200 [Arabis alpina]|uniref:NAC domain-containing protein n=1 Tax=Arabis alpina TaxID=50452 RepID=A0A087G736_ARAAL|nr:hypothetical protein AALP_AA8G146200 [Arabis alpina]